MMLTLQKALQATFIVALTVVYYIYKLDPVYIQGSNSANTTYPVKYSFGLQETDKDIREFGKCQKKNCGKVPNHILQYGRPRTATTLQFHIVCLMMAILHEDELNNVSCFFADGKFWKILKYNVIKTHIVPSAIEKVPPNSWIFMTSGEEISSLEKLKSTDIKKLIKGKNYTVPYIADVSLVSKLGHYIVYKYQNFFGLSDAKMEQIAEYFRYWDILRLCCGRQMSADWRYKLAPIDDNIPDHEPHSTIYSACEMYNISEVELGMINTYIFKKLSQSESLRRIVGKPDISNAKLDGTYCSRCNENIAKMKLKFNQRCD